MAVFVFCDFDFFSSFFNDIQSRPTGLIFPGFFENLTILFLRFYVTGSTSVAFTTSFSVNPLLAAPLRNLRKIAPWSQGFWT